MFTWSFISAVFQNDPIFWWTCVRISFRVVFTWDYIARNEILFLSKWPIGKSIPALSFRPTCALNAIFNKPALIRFVSSKPCSHENLMPVWNLISVKMTDMKPIPFWISFRLNSFGHKSWLNTEVRFSTEIKSHTGLSSFCLPCERTLRIWMYRKSKSAFVLW